MTSFAELLAAADPEGAAAIRALIDLAKAQAPEVTEGVSYAVPALRYHGRPLIGVGKNAKGYAIYPFSATALAAVTKDLDGYRLSTGAIGFDSGRPVPPEVVSQLIRLRIIEIDKTTR